MILGPPARQRVKPAPQISLQHQARRVLRVVFLGDRDGGRHYLTQPRSEPRIIRGPRFWRRVKKGENLFESGFVVDRIGHDGSSVTQTNEAMCAFQTPCIGTISKTMEEKWCRLGDSNT